MIRLLLIAISAQLALSALPSGWKGCKKSSPDFTKCLSKQIENAVASLKNGNKNLGVLPVEPLVFKTLMIDQSKGNGPVQIKLAFRDFKFHGLSKPKVIQIKNDWKVMDTKIHFDEIVTDGKYKINGKVLILPIQGDGDCKLRWQNMTVGARLMFKEVDRKSKKYFEVSEFLVDLQPQKMIVHFDNLFNGDKALGDNMNLFLNENWKEITDELKPAITKGLSQGFTQLANQVFSKIPKNEIDLK